MSHNIQLSPTLPVNVFSNLPKEVSFEIFSRIPLKTLCLSQQVSKQWLELTSNSLLWKRIWENKTGIRSVENGNWKAMLCAMGRIGRIKPEKTFFSIPFKVECIGHWDNRLVVKSLWRGFTFYRLDDLSQESCLSCRIDCLEMAFYRQFMITIHSGGEICLWDLNERKLKKIFQYATNHLCIDGDRMFSQNSNRMQEWSLPAFEIIAHYKIPKILSEKASLGCVREDLFAFYEDRVIYIYNRSQNSITSYHGHQSWIYKLEIVGSRMISCSHDRTIKIWSLITDKCLKTLKLSDEAWSFTVVGDTLYAYSFDRKIHCWRFKGGG
jgi:WD40 repeat protein